MDSKIFWFSLGILRIFPPDVHAVIMRKARVVRKIEIREAQAKPLCGRSSFSKRRRAKRLGACFHCGRVFHMKKYNQCSQPISGRATDRLNWIMYGQSKDFPDTPSYTSPVLTHYVRQKVGRVTNNVIDTSDDSD